MSDPQVYRFGDTSKGERLLEPVPRDRAKAMRSAAAALVGFLLVFGTGLFVIMGARELLGTTWGAVVGGLLSTAVILGAISHPWINRRAS